MKNATEVTEPDNSTIYGLCGSSQKGCMQGSEYSMFLLDGGSTVKEVLGYLEPRECMRTISCDWTRNWRNWKKNKHWKIKCPKTSLQTPNLGEEKLRKKGKDRTLFLVDGGLGLRGNTSGTFQILEDLSPEDIFKDVLMQEFFFIGSMGKKMKMSIRLLPMIFSWKPWCQLMRFQRTGWHSLRRLIT